MAPHSANGSRNIGIVGGRHRRYLPLRPEPSVTDYGKLKSVPDWIRAASNIEDVRRHLTTRHIAVLRHVNPAAVLASLVDSTLTDCSSFGYALRNKLESLVGSSHNGKPLTTQQHVMSAIFTAVKAHT